MKKQTKNQMWRELTSEEAVKINGGDSRQNQKARNLWELVVKILYI